jgi:hypothetical protein
MPTSRDALANARVPVARAAKGTPVRAKAAPGSEPKAPLADISQRNKENQVPSPMTPAKIRDSRSSTSRPSFYASRSSDGELPPLSVHSRFGLLCFTALLIRVGLVGCAVCGVQCAARAPVCLVVCAMPSTCAWPMLCCGMQLVLARACSVVVVGAVQRVMLCQSTELHRGSSDDAEGIRGPAGLGCELEAQQRIDRAGQRRGLRNRGLPLEQREVRISDCISRLLTTDAMNDLFMLLERSENVVATCVLWC